MKKMLLGLGVLTMMTGMAAAPVWAAGDTDGQGQRPRMEKGGHMFEKFDTNKDGVITQEEFLDQAKERFSTMDANGDGKVTKDEAQAAHEKMREKFKDMHEKRGGGKGGPGGPGPDDDSDDSGE